MDIEVLTRSDMDPCPRTQVAINGIPSGATVTLTRSHDGLTSEVRGAPKGPLFSGAVVVTDFETPLQTDVTYTATSSTGVSVSTQAYVASPFTYWDTVIMQDPLAPRTARAVVLSDQALGSVVTPRGGDQLRPAGSRLPVSVGGIGYAAASMPLQWYVIGEDHRADIETLLDAPVLLIRSVDRVPLPRLAYVALGGAQWDREPYISDARDRFWTCTASASLVKPPSAAIAAHAYTWADWQVDAQGITWADWQALMAGKTWFDFAKNPEPPNA